MAEIEKKWYALRVASSTEKKVKQNIENEVEASHLGEFVTRILIPTEKVYQIRNGKKVSKENTLYPGYLFVEAAGLDKVMHLLLSIPGVLGFVGCKHKTDTPPPLHADEVQRMLGDEDTRMSQDESLVIPFIVGEEIKVTDGPFNSFTGVIEEINAEKKKLKVTVKIFGRKTPLELGFMQVEKV
jgi:transcriptional antiterminator NusG